MLVYFRGCEIWSRKVIFSHIVDFACKEGFWAVEWGMESGSPVGTEGGRGRVRNLRTLPRLPRDRCAWRRNRGEVDETTPGTHASRRKTFGLLDVLPCASGVLDVHCVLAARYKATSVCRFERPREPADRCGAGF